MDQLLAQDPDLKAACVRVRSDEPFRQSTLGPLLDALKHSSAHEAALLRLVAESSISPLSPTQLERIIRLSARYCTKHVSSVVVIVAKCLAIDREAVHQTLRSIVEDSVLQDSHDSILAMFHLLTLVMQIDASVGQSLFTMDEIQHKQFSMHHFLSTDIVLAALESLSAACVSKECRTIIAANYVETATDALNSTNKSVSLLAACVLVKTANQTGAEADKIVQLSTKFINVLQLSHEQETAAALSSQQKKNLIWSLEALAFTSAVAPVKAQLMPHTHTLVAILGSATSKPLTYSVLCILANLTEYTPKLTSDQEKLQSLKTPADQQPTKEPDDVVTERCKALMDHKVVETVLYTGSELSTASCEVAAVLLRNLVVERSHRRAFAQNGGLAMAVYLVLPQKNHKGPPAALIQGKPQACAVSALAKTLISVEPDLCNIDQVPLTALVTPLAGQLLNDNCDLVLLDTFEALLALTNLAAQQEECRASIVTQHWEKVETLMTHSHTLVQRGALELICNLAQSPYCAEKFLDGSKAAASKLDLLVALTGVQDEKARTAAAGAVALLSEWGLPVVSAMARPNVLSTLSDLVADETSGLPIALRAMAALANLSQDPSCRNLKKTVSPATAYLQSPEFKQMYDSL